MEWEDDDKGPSYSRKLKTARERAGFTIEDIARRVKISPASYRDLEDFETELFDTLSLESLLLLLETLRINPAEFFSHALDVRDVAERVRRHLTENDVTLSDLESEIGWELAAFLDDPTRLDAYPLQFIADLCTYLGIDWAPVIANLFSKSETTTPPT